MKPQKYFIVLAFAICIYTVTPSVLFAQGAAPASVEMDAAAYRLDSGHSVIEVSYGVLYRTLNFVQSKGGWVSQIAAKVEAQQGEKLIAGDLVTQEVRFEGTKAELEAAGATKIVGTIPLVVSASTDAKVRLIWRYSLPNGNAALDTIPKNPLLVALPDTSTIQFALSSIELASNTEKATKVGGATDKYGYTVTPNPSSIFGDTYTKLFYYAELYLPSSAVSESASVDITSIIQDGVGHTLVKNTRSQKLIAGLIPLFGSLDIDGLPEDRYNLIVVVSRGEENLAQTKKAFYFESGMKLSEEATPTAQTGGDDQSVFLNSEISKMSDAQIDEGFAYAGYIAKPEEVKTYQTLTDISAKRKFFFDFWRKRDTPSDKPLTFYQHYRERTDEANKTYTYQKTPGWKSAQGRVLMTYGKPDHTYSRLFSVEAKAFKVWEYENKSILVNTIPGEETGSVNFSHTLPHFIFLDRQGGGKFILIHSNVQGETSEPGWYSTDARVTN